MVEVAGGRLYRDSTAWQKAMKLTGAIYDLTREFPSDERFGLTNQLRRAAVSVPSNIAEGKGRLSEPELIRFIGIARGSTLEVQTQLDIAAMLSYGTKEKLIGAHNLAEEVVRMLNASLTTMRSKA